MNPCFETATRLARAIRNGRLNSADATQAHVGRIALLNGPLNDLPVVDHNARGVATLSTTSSHLPLKNNVAVHPARRDSAGRDDRLQGTSGLAHSRINDA
jgi:hypothetical protein